MKKFILALLLISFLVVPAIGLATPTQLECDAAELLGQAACLAAGCEWDNGNCVVPGTGAGQLPGEAPIKDPLEMLDTIINVLFVVLVIVAVIFIILGAFTLLTAQGDAEKITTGRTQILYAIIAVVVAIAARGLVNWVQGVF